MSTSAKKMKRGEEEEQEEKEEEDLMGSSSSNIDVGTPVSYTHLDVYKRQAVYCKLKPSYNVRVNKLVLEKQL